MKDIRDNKMLELKAQGYSYNEIAKELNISKSTVASFFRRNEVYDEVDALGVCKNCEKTIIQKKKTKRKVFCSDECRVEWWNSNLDKVVRSAYYEFECATCGEKFKAYGNTKRKYCSPACYRQGRYKKGGE